MIIIVKGRGEGKTTAVAEWLLENLDERWMIVCTWQDKANFRRVAGHVLTSKHGRDLVRELLLKLDKRVFTVSDILAMRHRGTNIYTGKIGIDDTDRVMQAMLGKYLYEYGINNASVEFETWSE